MDQRLLLAFLNYAPPFDGVTVEAHHLSLREAVSFSRLIAIWFVRHAGEFYWQNQDWHFHDGFIFDSVRRSTIEVLAWPETEQSFLDHLSDDDFVAKAFYSVDMVQFWRVTRCGQAEQFSIDVTAPEDVLKLLAWADGRVRVSAGEFFSKGHSGLSF